MVSGYGLQLHKEKGFQVKLLKISHGTDFVLVL